jgi:hypothetical protein
MNETAPQFPAGQYVAQSDYDAAHRAELINDLASTPAALSALVSSLTDDQLDTKYRNWTIRQIVNHLAESHMNAYMRFKWALTEDNPTIKPYDETRWSDLIDAKTGSIEPALELLSGLHAKWDATLRNMTDEQFERAYFHPELNENVSLKSALPTYVWHCHHHSAQIKWLIEKHDW